MFSFLCEDFTEWDAFYKLKLRRDQALARLLCRRGDVLQQPAHGW
jgi:hypothetical protein